MCALLACAVFVMAISCTFVRRSGAFGAGSIYSGKPETEPGLEIGNIEYDIKIAAGKVFITANYSLNLSDDPAFVSVPFFTAGFNADSFKAAVGDAGVPVSYGYREGFDANNPYEVLKPLPDVPVPKTSDMTVHKYLLTSADPDSTVTFRHKNKREILFVDAPGFLEGEMTFAIGEGLYYYAESKFGDVTGGYSQQLESTNILSVIRLFCERYLEGAAVGDTGSGFADDFFKIVMMKFAEYEEYERDYPEFFGMIKDRYDKIFVGEAEIAQLDSVYIANFTVSGGQAAKLATSYSAAMNIGGAGNTFNLYMPHMKDIADGAEIGYKITSDVQLTVNTESETAQDGLTYIYSGKINETDGFLKISYESGTGYGAVETAFMFFLVAALILTTGAALGVFIFQIIKRPRPPAPPYKFK